MGTLLMMTNLLLVLTMQVDLRLDPSDQVATVGQIIEVELTASSGVPHSISAIDAIISWDPARLQLISGTLGDFPSFVSGFLPDPDGINDDITDGEALYTVLAAITTPGTVPPDLHVATFEFMVITSACVALVPSVGSFGKTRVIGVVPGQDITGTIGEAVTVEVPGGWVDLGGSIPGTGGLTPMLTGEGIMLSCDDVTLTVINVQPGILSYLVIGGTAINVPFKGGVLVPSLDIIVGAFVSGAGGSIVFTAPWPAVIPPGFTVYYQFWFKDAGAVQGFAASNGLSGTAP